MTKNDLISFNARQHALTCRARYCFSTSVCQFSVRR